MLTNEEVRHLVVSLLTKETDRDRQTRVGASDLANPCDYCLAAKMAGVNVRDAIDDRYYLGRLFGTGIGMLLEDRAQDDASLEPEKHVWFGDIPGYGPVGGSIDLNLAGEDHLIDYKSAYRRDIALLEDYLQSLGLWRVGEEPRWEKQKDTARYEGGHKLRVTSDTTISLSKRDYDGRMAKMRHKVDGYYNQLTLYMNSGVAQRASIVFIARDGNGAWDNPALDGYEDPRKKRDVFVWSFDYSEDHANAVLNRAGDIWSRLEAGASLDDFESDELCFVCSRKGERDSVSRIVDIFEKKEEVA